MGRNTKKTSNKVASQAARVLKDPKASKIQKELAGSALSQVNRKHQTGAEMEEKASKVLRSDRYSDETKDLAASVLAQSNRDR